MAFARSAVRRLAGEGIDTIRLSPKVKAPLITNSGFLQVSEEVREALHSKKPVVALETTIYTHGFPYPDNVALASHLESVVRVNGGVPATIGVLDGVAKVGFQPEELIRLTASAGKETTLKLSRRDLSFVCGLRLAGLNYNGGTTIAGTMVLAHLAGIKVFATGGLGGVHRGAESSMDVSADLTELGRTPVTVISSGCKSFLDIPRTLEYLETEGVGVATFADGREGKVDFPCFYSRDSGVRSPMVLQNEMEAAAVIYAQDSLGITSGLHFANPIPEASAIPKEEMDVIIEQALREAPIGKDNTPFVLNKIKELSGNKSVKANKALIEANVKRGTLVAKELTRLAREGVEGLSFPSIASSDPSFVGVDLPSPASTSSRIVSDNVQYAMPDAPRPDMLVAGALAVDFSCDYKPFANSGSSATSPALHTSNPAVIRQTMGGVGHNVARTAHLLGEHVQLLSAVGDDLSGKSAMAALQEEGMDTGGIQTIAGGRTAQYVAINDADKSLTLAMADMAIFDSPPVELMVTKIDEAKPTWLVVDANFKRPIIRSLLEAGKRTSATTAFEPVSVAKSAELFSSSSQSTLSTLPSQSEEPLPVFPNHIVDVATPTLYELASMHSAASEADLFERQDWWQVINNLGIPSTGARMLFVQAVGADLVDQGLPQQSVQLLPFIPTILTKLGPKGVLVTMLLAADDVRLSAPDVAPYVLARSGNSGAGEVGGLYMRLFPPERVLGDGEVVSVNGVGDTFLGALVTGMMASGRGVEHVVPFAQSAAWKTLKSEQSVGDMSSLRRSLESL